MKKLIATLIAGLFATAAFAQTPVPASTAAATVQPAAVQADTMAAKDAAKVDAKAAKVSAKHAKKSAKHAAAAKDSTVAVVTPAPAK